MPKPKRSKRDRWHGYNRTLTERVVGVVKNVVGVAAVERVVLVVMAIFLATRQVWWPSSPSRTRPKRPRALVSL